MGGMKKHFKINCNLCYRIDDCMCTLIQRQEMCIGPFRNEVDERERVSVMLYRNDKRNKKYKVNSLSESIK